MNTSISVFRYLGTAVHYLPPQKTRIIKLEPRIRKHDTLIRQILVKEIFFPDTKITKT
jgi:hypothetical protein